MMRTCDCCLYHSVYSHFDQTERHWCCRRGVKIAASLHLVKSCFRPVLAVFENSNINQSESKTQ